MVLTCTQCGTTAEPSKRTAGSFRIEFILWLLFIVPGIIYSLWRLSTRKETCSCCGSTTLIPPDSPLARKIQEETGTTPPAEPFRPVSPKAVGNGRKLGRLVGRLFR